MTTASTTTRTAPDPVTTDPKRERVPTVNQMSQVECGAAALAMILAHYGRWVPLTELRNATGISRDGATALDIVHGAEKYGLEGQGHLGPMSKLEGLSVPAIVWFRRSHFVVLEGAHGGHFYINDPGSGRYRLTTEEFAEEYSDAALTFTPTKDFTRGGHPFRVTKPLAERLRHSKRGTTFAILAGLLVMLLGLLIAPLSQMVVNDYLVGGDVAVVPALIGAFVMVGLLRGGLTVLQFGVLTRLQTKFSLVGSASFLDHLMRMPILFYLQRSAGDLSQRVTYNVGVAQLLASQIASAGIALLSLIGYAILLFYYQWAIALVVLALSLLNVLTLQVVLTRRRSAQSRVIHAQNNLRGTTVASVRSIETIKATGGEDDVFDSLAGQQAQYVSAQAQLVNATALLGSVPTVLISLTSASILVIGGLLVLSGSFSLGALLAMFTLAANLNSPIQTLMATGSQLQVINANLESLDDVTRVPEDPSLTSPGTQSLDRPQGRITLDHVTFGYSSTHRPVITDFSLDLRPGSRIALVGTTGAGKTTIGEIAVGLLEPWSGRVEFDGTPLTDYAPGALTGVLAKVDQTIVLFEGTVRQNVTLWNTAIPTEDVVRALRDAQIVDDVLARPGGLDTRVDEDGRNFSGGQRQRLEIARALATNPRCLVLDEATSALDDDTEKAVDDALRARGISCLIIAHRLSTIRDSDEIVVLGRGGSVVERGTHDDLMAAQGEYYQLVSDAGEGGDVGT